MGLFAAVFPTVAQTILIDSQEDFDRLGSAIDSLAEGSVHVRFEPGTYYYSECHLDFTEYDRPGLDLTLEGNGAVMIAEGKDFMLNAVNGYRAAYDKDFSVDDGFVSLLKMQTEDFRDPVKQALSFPLPVNLRKRLFRIRCYEEDLSERDAKDAYIILTQWYVGAVYKVREIRHGWLYFHAYPTYGTRMWEELRYGRCRPRYILYNGRSLTHPSVVGGMMENADREVFHRCEATSFLRMDGVRIGSFRMEGFHFLGNRASDYLLRFDDVKADSLVISRCRFEGVKSHVVGIFDTEHVRFRNNLMEHCYLRGFYSDFRSGDIEVTHNRFLDHGLMLSTAPAVYCQSRGFLISDNYFEDYSYCAIGLGTHYTESDQPYAEGIVENNEIFQTASFRRKPMRSLVDSGAIYVWTQNRNVVIRRNYIHDISGHHGNRGILCDDGTTNVTVCNNLIIGIDNHSYCIDLRKRYDIGRKKNSLITRVNVGNKMWGNWVDGRVRFHVRKDDPESFRGENVILKPGFDRDDTYRRWSVQNVPS